MKFDFLPYKLNTHSNSLKQNLKYEGKEDEVKMYAVQVLPLTSILNVSIKQITLYFLDEKLISVYYRLDEISSNWERVVITFEKYFKRHSMCWEEDEGYLYNWENKAEFLGILVDKKENCIFLYHTLKEYNIFDEALYLFPK